MISRVILCPRYVQTEVDSEIYARLLGIAMSRGTSLKQQVKQALEEFTKRYEGEAKKDSILSLIGSFETKEGDWSKRKEWRP